MQYFTLRELGTDTEEDFHPGFLDKLIQLREEVGLPFIVTSCVRTSIHNTKVGGVSTSLHISDKCSRDGQLGTMAVDIAILSPRFKTLVIELALASGWSVGLNDKQHFIHLDRRTDIGEAKTIFGY